MPITVPRRLALASLLLVAACSSKSTGPNQNALVGTWIATQAVFTDKANAANTFDAIANGFGLTMMFDAANGYTVITTAPGTVPDTAMGTVTLNGSMIRLVDVTADTTAGTYSISGNTMTVHFTDGITFDFGSGDVPANIDGILAKQ